MKTQQNKKMKNLLFYGAMVFLFLYTFRKVNEGIDVTDTGYHFSNFMYMSEMDPMWIFSTYLASVLGNAFTRMPGGDTLSGMMVYTSIIPALLGVMTYVFFVRVVELKVWESFLGVLVALALCWCPTTCVYNYLTYFFFCVGAMLLYMGLIKDKPKLLVGAGICLGANVLVRFPNVAEAALIVVVWYTCFLRREKFRQCVQKTGWCLLGYLAGMGIVFVQIGLKYGIGEYVNGIVRLLGMTGDASDYTLYSMIYHLIQAYLFSGKWVLLMAVCVLLGLLGFMVLPGKFMQLKCIGYAACLAVLVRWFYGQGMFNLAYDGYGSIFNWGAVVIIGALLFAIWQLLSTKVAEAEKILSVIVIVIIGITPLGSNNQLYANLNNMFFIVPYVIHVLVKLVSGDKEFVLRVKNHTLTISKWPLIFMTATCVIMLFVQSLLFGHVFIFRDVAPRNNKVISIVTVKGRSTNKANADTLEELGEYVEKAKLKGKKVLLFGDVPGLSGYLKMPFVMSPWPDLPSYSNATFEAELEQVLINIEENRPIIILGADFYEFLTNQLEDIEVKNAYEAKYGYKTALLCDMIETYDYKCTFANEAYVIYE